MNIQKYQIFEVIKGRWIETTKVNAPSSGTAYKQSYFAIIDGKPYPVEFKFIANDTVIFSEGYGDGELRRSYEIMANEVIIGHCAHIEY